VIGFPVDALVKKVIEPGVDVNGQPKKTTKYLPTDIVSYDEKHKQYVITLPDDKTPSEEALPSSEENDMEAPAEEPSADPTDKAEDTPAEQEAPTDAPIF